MLGLSSPNRFPVINCYTIGSLKSISFCAYFFGIDLTDLFLWYQFSSHHVVLTCYLERSCVYPACIKSPQSLAPRSLIMPLECLPHELKKRSLENDFDRG